jgi:hypothetical protein
MTVGLLAIAGAVKHHELARRYDRLHLSRIDHAVRPVENVKDNTGE